MRQDDKQLLGRIKQIDKELASRKHKNRIFFYNTGKGVHQKQLEFHKCLKRNRWVFGGNRSGKTECGAVEVIYLARGIHPHRSCMQPVSGWVVSLSTQVQRDVAQSKILYYLNPDWIDSIIMQEGSRASPANGVIDYILVRHINGGLSKIGFKTCDQGREKFQGASLDFVWFDEEPPKDIYDECRMRLLDKCGTLFGTMTPLKGLTFLYNEIFLNDRQDPEVWHIFMEWADNPFLNTKEIEALTKTMAETELESRRYGKFYHAGGSVYPEFDEKLHVIEPFAVPEAWQAGIAIDPGLHNPLSAHFYAVDFDGNVYVIAEHYEAGRSIEHHANAIKMLAARLNWRRGYGNRLEALIDSAANQRTLAATQSVAELFFEQGIAVNTCVNKDLFSGINTVKRYLKDASGRIRLFIFKTCVHLIQEIKGYFWGNADVPIKKDDHALDELRYFLMSRPENVRPSQRKTIIQKDKERLYRRLNR